MLEFELVIRAHNRHKQIAPFICPDPRLLKSTCDVSRVQYDVIMLQEVTKLEGQSWDFYSTESTRFLL